MSEQISDPRTNVNRWLENVLVDLLKRVQEGDESCVTQLREAIRLLTILAEPGMVEEYFQFWITNYLDLMDSKENNQNNSPETQKLLNQMEADQQCEIVSK